MSKELININGIREDLYQAMQIGDITLSSKNSQELYDFMSYQDKEIERLNNKLKDIKSQLDYLETYSSKEDVFEDMKRRLDRIDKIIGSGKNEPNKEEK